jgi:hypothetical protein
MLKQSSSRMKKVLAIFMAVLFGVSLTAVAASADIGEHRDHGNQRDFGRGDHRDVGRGEHGDWGWGNDYSHHHWWHGQYYPNCDWVLSPRTNQWVWAC